jgi:phosphoserine phosphatase
MRELVLLEITAEDRPGVVAGLSETLAAYDVDILDIGQAVIHDSLTLGILIRIPPQAESAPILKELLFAAHELDIGLTFTAVPEERYERWVSVQGRPRYIVTLLGRKIGAKTLHGITRALADSGMNIDVITRLSGRAPLSEQTGALPNACVEFSVRGEPRDQNALRRQFLDIAASQNVDIAFQEDNVFRRNRRLVAFDMDSTLVRVEVIDELAKLAGVGEQVAAITEAAMRGELDFSQSLKQRLALLKGLPESKLAEVAANLPLSEGAERLIQNLKRFGYKIAILSGGFGYFGRRLQERFGVDYVHANELEIRDGVVTGRVIGEIVDGRKKAELLTAIALQEGISLQQVIAVGDGANDLPMLTIAGLGIAFHAKPKVKEGAGHAISTFGLDSILYLIGVRDRDIVD